MALSAITELPFHNPNPLCSSRLLRCRCRFRLLFSATASSLRLADRTSSGNGESDPPPNPRSPPSSPWLTHWSPPDPPPPHRKPPSASAAKHSLDRSSAGSGAIERIVHRLRNLGLGPDEGEDPPLEPALMGDESLGELLERRWNRPGMPDVDQGVLPWERDDGFKEEAEGKEVKKRRVRAPTMAELTIEDSELRRLRRIGITLRERMTVAKAGVTQVMVEKIHQAWKRSEVVRLKFHEVLAHDMKTAHQLVEHRTGGLVIWRSGSVMVVYRGSNYKQPSRSQSSDVESIPTKISHDGETLFVPDVSGSVKLIVEEEDHSLSSTSSQVKPSQMSLKSSENMTEEETEFNRLLDSIGPRFVDWWGTGILPVDADLLPQNIPGYKTPFRILPTGMRSRLTNSEMTNLRKLAKGLPCHFALGRNRHHHGLAAAILKIWETSLVVKIAVKRGVQNTNNKLMAEELKRLTGGLLLLRNKYYIVIYRGKDFLPTTVATALAEREELTKDIQDVEEKARNSTVGEPLVDEVEGHALAGTLAEFQEAQARWGRIISAEEREAMKKEAARSVNARLLKKIEHKLSIAEAKKSRAEKLLAKIEASMVPVNPPDDQETITDEERSVFRRIGLRMKSYLPVGIRGIFDGVIENMHLHWKHRELVKLISKQKTLSFVEETAQLLEYESGGILVAIERVPKGFALIFYRGKNYQRPANLRPRNLLTKAKALKRSVAMQRHEALSQHITDLERTIEQMKLDLGDSKVENGTSVNQQIQSDHDSFLSQSEVEEFSEDDDYDEDTDSSDQDDVDDGDDEDSDSFDEDDDNSEIPVDLCLTKD